MLISVNLRQLQAGFDEIPVEIGGLLKSRFRLSGVALSLKDQSEIVIAEGVVRLHLDRAPELLFSVRGSALEEREDTEVVIKVGILQAEIGADLCCFLQLVLCLTVMFLRGVNACEIVMRINPFLGPI